VQLSEVFDLVSRVRRRRRRLRRLCRRRRGLRLALVVSRRLLRLRVRVPMVSDRRPGD